LHREGAMGAKWFIVLTENDFMEHVVLISIDKTNIFVYCINTTKTFLALSFIINQIPKNSHQQINHPRGKITQAVTAHPSSWRLTAFVQIFFERSKGVVNHEV
jgi:hypothetical protein